MSLRTGPGSLSIKKPSKAKLRRFGEQGRATQEENRGFSTEVPF